MKKEPLLFYFISGFISVLIIGIINFQYLSYLIPKFNINSIVISVIYIVFLIFCEVFFGDKNSNRIHNEVIDNIFGNKRNTFKNFFISLICSTSEELIFRFFLFILIVRIFGFNIYFSVILLSIIFGILHITQGIYGLILSLITSLIFYVITVISKSIFIPVVLHVGINFIQLELLQKEIINK